MGDIRRFIDAVNVFYEKSMFQNRFKIIWTSMFFVNIAHP